MAALTRRRADCHAVGFPMNLLTAGRFFVPGPTEVRPEIMRALTGPMIPHRSPAFEALYASLQEGLRTIFGTNGAVLVTASSGTGMMEAAVRCAPPGAILALVNGAFSGRFADIARACGREVECLEVPFGQVVPLDRVEHALQRRRFAAVLVVHCETSTGARADIRAVSDLAHRHGALALIDSVSGLGGLPIACDDWDLDFVCTASQKALALPPGLSLAAVSPRYLDQVAAAPDRGRYFDLAEVHRWATQHQTPATPALPLMYALEVQGHAIMAEGMATRWQRHAAMAAHTAAWIANAEARTGHALGILAAPSCRSETVTVVILPAYISGPALVAAVARRGYTLAEGYGPLREGTVRIGHMGDHTISGLNGLFTAIDQALAEFPEPRIPR